MDQRPDLGVRVAVRDGRLTGVSVRPPAVSTRAGQTLAGAYGPGSRSWRTRWALAPSQAYRVTATAVDAHGRRTVMAGTFRTLRPRRTFAAGDLTGFPQCSPGSPVLPWPSTVFPSSPEVTAARSGSPGTPCPLPP